MLYTTEHSDNAITIASSYLNQLNDTISFYNKVFLVCYIVGSVLLALAFLADFINKT